MKGFWGRRTGLALGALIASVVASTLAQANGVAAGPGPISRAENVALLRKRPRISAAPARSVARRSIW